MIKKVFAKLYDRVLSVVLKGDVYARRCGVKVGQGCRILSHNFGTEPFLIEIGDRVTISGYVNFVNHDGSGWLMRDERGRRFTYRRIRIGSDVFVGAGTIILPGVSIGDRVVVGAGSVVTRSIPDGCVVAGNPARMIATYDAFQARVLKDWPADADLPKDVDYEARVRAVMDESFKPPIAVTPQAPRG
ncbi:MAG: acyltransferase [Caulobacter sp.]|nr:acyltransferase [Caulobacter sp.]